MKFGPKLFLILGALIFLLVALSSAVAGGLIGDTYEVVSTEALSSAREIITGTLLDRESRSHLLLRPLVNDARIRAGLAARTGLADPAQLGGNAPEERKQNADDYFGSFMDEYWVLDRDKQQQLDLMLLVGVDGTVAYGLAGDTRHVELEDDVVQHRQISALLKTIAGGEESARMLWSGDRLRTEAPAVPALERGLYFAEASKVVFHTAGTGADEMIGVALVAAHLDLGRILATSADAVFVDKQTVASSTFALRGGGAEQVRTLEADAARFIAANPTLDERLVPATLGGVSYFATAFRPKGLTRGPVSAALFYSRQRELQQVEAARTELAQVGLGLALLAIAIAWVVSRRLSRPINALSDAALKVAAGDLQISVPDKRRDELGELARRFNQMVQGLRERERAKDALGRYLSKEMAQDVVTGHSGVSLQGQRRPLTILFCDVAGFTTISEKLEPEALVALLNEYLDEMVRVLIGHGAYVDKFEGDAIMAFWNAPRDTADHAVQGCLAVLEMRAAAIALSAKWKANGHPEFGVRYGLNTGDAIVGNMGATDKINYTAIGDNVNLASRLEGANKQYGTQLLIAEETFEAAREHVEARELDVVKVKGKTRPVRVYELLAAKGQLLPEQTKIHARFAAGLELYRKRQFSEAKALFDAGGGDGPSRTFAARCARFLERPPGADWDGTYEMETK